MNYDDEVVKQLEKAHQTMVDHFSKFDKEMFYIVEKRDKAERTLNILNIVMNTTLTIGAFTAYWLVPPERKLFTILYWLVLAITYFGATITRELVKLNKRRELDRYGELQKHSRSKV